MGHSEHFLERLDRLSAQHTEEALLLYNDPPLLRTVLDMARVPERVERVALALGDDGPYVLVTRAGQFITCLGAGMVVDDVPVVSRQQLDDFTGKVGELRARMELARSLVGTDKRGGRKLVDRLTTAGSDLSREEFAALVLLQPLLVKELLKSLFMLADYLSKVRDRIAALKLGKRNRQLERVMHDYWNAYWASGHLTLLLATNGPALFASMPDDLAEKCRSLFAWGTIRQEGVGLSLRGSWAVGRLGKTMLPAAKQRVREPRSPAHYMTGALSLVSLAARHTGLRAEALKELASTPSERDFPEASLLQRAVYATASLAFEQPDGTVDITRVYAEASLEARRKVRHLAMTPLPDARLLPVLSLDLSNFFLDQTAAQCLFILLPHVARASAEDFYLPRADLDTFGYGPWIPAYSHALLEPLAERPAAPVKAVSSVGRNDPCTCGSGKKSKKCCAA